MKKQILVISIIGMLLAIPFASASAASRFTSISGIVSSGSEPVSRAQVLVTCNGHEQSTTTNTRGQYRVFFNAKNCCKGSTVTVTADKGSQSGQSTGTFSNSDYLRINISLESVNLPEFGPLTFVGAASFSASILVYIRRRIIQTLNI